MHYYHCWHKTEKALLHLGVVSGHTEAKARGMMSRNFVSEGLDIRVQRCLGCASVDGHPQQLRCLYRGE